MEIILLVNHQFGIADITGLLYKIIIRKYHLLIDLCLISILNWIDYFSTKNGSSCPGITMSAISMIFSILFIAIFSPIFIPGGTHFK